MRARERGGAAPPHPHCGGGISNPPRSNCCPGQPESNRGRIRAYACTCMAMDRPTGAGKGRAAPAAACAARGARPSPGNETGLRRRPGSSSGYWFWNWVKQKKSPVGLRSTCTCTCCCCLLLAASLPATCRLILASMRAPVSPSWRRHMVRVHGNDASDSLRSQLSTRGNREDYSS